MSLVQLVPHPLHIASQIMVHVVEDHVDAAFHIVGRVCCRETQASGLGAKQSKVEQIVKLPAPYVRPGFT